MTVTLYSKGINDFLSYSQLISISKKRKTFAIITVSVFSSISILLIQSSVDNLFYFIYWHFFHPLHWLSWPCRLFFYGLPIFLFENVNALIDSLGDRFVTRTYYWHCIHYLAKYHLRGYFFGWGFGIWVFLSILEMCFTFFQTMQCSYYDDTPEKCI